MLRDVARINFYFLILAIDHLLNQLRLLVVGGEYSHGFPHAITDFLVKRWRIMVVVLIVTVTCCLHFFEKALFRRIYIRR